MNKKEKAAMQAGIWWAKRLQKGDKEQFAKEIQQRVLSQLQKSDSEVCEVHLECDYDPKGILLEALNAIGINCSGYFFSAKGILPEKHHLVVTENSLLFKEGYGNWTKAIAIV